MIITTSLRENETLIARAQELAHELGVDYQPRRKLSLAKCLERFGAFYLLYKEQHCHSPLTPRYPLKDPQSLLHMPP